MPSAGETICGDVLLEAQAPASLGAAPLHPVFLARSEATPEPLWLTVVDGAFLPTSIDVSRFMAGANGLVGLRHPTLARVVLVDREADYCVVGHEALPGAEPLGDVIARGEATPHLARAALEIARGLAFLHGRGLVHGALTPRSVVLWEGVPVLCQYGIAALCVSDVFGPCSRKLGGDVVAPEVASGDPVTPESDVFAWGSIIAALATGRSGIEAVGSVLAKEARAPGHEALLELATDALDPMPENRPADGVALLQRIRAALDSTAARPKSAMAPPWMPQRSEAADLQQLAAQYLQETAEAEGAAAAEASFPDELESGRRGKRRTPLPNVAPGGALPRAPEPAPGWLRPSDKGAEDDPQRTPGSRPRWPVAHDLGDGVRKRTFAQPGSPQAPMEGDTPRDPLLAGEGPAPVALEHEGGETAGVALATAPEPEPCGAPTGPEPLQDSGEDDQPTLPAGEATVPSSSDPVRAFTPYRPPRMPGPHGPPPVVLAVLLALLVGAVAVSATIRTVTARGSLSTLWDPSSIPQGARGGGGIGVPLTACGEGTTRLPGPPDDPLAMVCIEIAEYPGWLDLPRIDVDFVEAQRLCAERGRRLCTSEEWQRACKGIEGRRLPYGDARARGYCRTAGQGEREVGPSGGDADCASPEGVYDLVGNAAEWSAEGVLLGGSVANKSPDCDTRTQPPPPSRKRGKGSSTPMGARCCHDLR